MGKITAVPEKGKRNILITSALPYVNNVPHLGNIVGCVLSADVYARYCRLKKYNVIYVCGTDEYGTATETKALQEGVTPKEICDKYHAIHKQCYEWFDISFDHFGRTSTKEQTEITQDIFKQCDANGFVNEQETEQVYCETDGRFLADRFVEGTCPNCHYEDARGDQCDGCGKLLDPVQLIDPRCKVCGSKSVAVRKTRHQFLDLKHLEGEVKAWVEKSSREGNWSANSLSATQAWFRDGLRARSITRDLKWGTPVPKPGYEDKVFYVWFDAPIGYISITACATPEWEQWWKNPENVELTQFMGKDNVPFHCLIFPSTLLATRQPWTLLNKISTTDWLNYESGKFSKSRNIGIFGDTVQETGLPVEVWRYYLLINRPESGDTIFLWDDFLAKNNAELNDNLGNYVQRATKFCADKYEALVPSQAELKDIDTTLIKEVDAEIETYLASLESIKLKEGLKACIRISHLGNVYLQHNEPWKLIKSDPERCGTVVNINLQLTYLLATLLEPYLPSTSRKILEQLAAPLEGYPEGEERWEQRLKPGHQIGKPQPLFRKLSGDEIEKLKLRFQGPVKEKFPADLRVGVIEEAENHPNPDAQKLYKLGIRIDAKTVRPIVSGLREHYSLEELKGRRVVVLCNLRAQKFKGVASQGMVLVSEEEGRIELLQPPPDAAPGTSVLPEGQALEAPPKFDVKMFAQLGLAAKDGTVVLGSKALLADGKPISTQKINGIVK